MAKKTSAAAIASMVLGIFSIFLGYIPIFGWAIVITGLILAIKSLKNIRKNKNISGIGFAKTGIILNSIGLILAVGVCLFIVIFLISGIDNDPVVHIEKLSASEPLVNEYVNDYMGISLSYPDSVEAKPIGVSYKTLSENVKFISSKETACFQIELFYERFDKDIHDEYSLDGWDDIKQVESFLIIKSVNALPAPMHYKIENITEIMVNDTNYYTYSFKHTRRSQRDIRRDILIYPRGHVYYKFTFLNQDKDFIMNIMGSVKYIDSADLGLSKIRTGNCAGDGEQFSKVYVEDYPENCCEGLEEWESGMDTSIAIGDECYATGARAGSPVGTCINCGNGICEDIENPCNCHEDCAGGKNSRHLNVREFCDSSSGKRLMEECSFGMDLPICGLC